MREIAPCRQCKRWQARGAHRCRDDLEMHPVLLWDVASGVARVGTAWQSSPASFGAMQPSGGAAAPVTGLCDPEELWPAMLAGGACDGAVGEQPVEGCGEDAGSVMSDYTDAAAQRTCAHSAGPASASAAAAAAQVGRRTHCDGAGLHHGADAHGRCVGNRGSALGFAPGRCVSRWSSNTAPS